MLRCDTGYGSKGVSFAAHPALEGTSCGRDKVYSHQFRLMRYNNIHAY